MPSPSLPFSTGLLLSLALMPGLALAQTDTPSPASGDTAMQLPEVSVSGAGQTSTGPVQGYVANQTATATKTDTPLLETPQSISVITRDRMNDQAVRNVEEALRYTAGVTTGLTGQDPRFDSARIRGFDAANSQYLDGLRLLRTNGPTAIEQYGLERIEVLRGPSSVLYGQTAPGGLINLVSKRPTTTPFGEMFLQGGSFDRVEGGIDVGGPLTSDGQFLYRLTGLVRSAQTQTDHVNDDRYFLAPALTWRPDADTSLTLLGRFQYDQANSPIGLPAVGTLFYNPNGQIARNRFIGSTQFNQANLRYNSIGWVLEHRFSDVFSFRQNARYLNNSVDYNTLYGSGLSADGTTLRRGSLVQRESSDTINLDNTVQAKFNTGPLSHTVLAGFDYRQFWGDSLSVFGSAPSINLYNPVESLPVPDPRLSSSALTLNTHNRLRQVGAYAQEQLRWDKWLVTLGGREDWAETGSTTVGTTTRSDKENHAFTGRAALMYLFDSGVAPYFSYSTSFDPVTGTTAPQRGGGTFQPTEGRQYEVGVKYQPPGRNSFMTVAGFDITQTNVSTTDPLYTGFSVQTGKVHSRGVEVEAVASLMDGLNLIANYTFLDAEITRDNGGNQGNRPALVPRHQGNVWLDYHFQPGSKLGAANLEGLSVSGGVRAIGDLYGDNANTFRSPAVTLVDAAIRYDFAEHYRVALNVSNLFDKTYIASCQGSFYCYYGTGRTVIGNLAYRW